jgi:phosphoesterase RecJ-like protein
MIDHHLDPEPFYHYGLSDTTASSTAELVYEFINYLEDTRFIGPDIATCIMTGLITDTGSFKYNTRPATFICAAKMQERGIDVKDIQDEIFNSMKIKQMKLLSHALFKRMEILEEYSTAIIVLNKYDYANFDIQRGDTEGIVNYLLMMKDIKLAAFITQQPQIVKISLRSKGDISAQEIARDHFRGGGHKNAAGGALYGSLSSVINKFKEVLPNYMKKIEIENI